MSQGIRSALNKLDDMIESQLSEISQTDHDLRNVKWSINRIKFELFSC